MAWYNSNWIYRIKVTVQNVKVDADLTDFSIYTDLSNLPVEFHTNVNQTDARDIRVTKSDGTTEVPREVVSYDSSSDKGELYFKGDILDASDVDFYIYYGNNSAADYAITDTYGAENAWESSYTMIQHMDDSTTSLIKDSTSNGNDGTKKGANEPIETTAGKIGLAQNFDGTDDYISLASDISLSRTGSSVEMWVYLDSYPTGKYGDTGFFVSKGNKFLSYIGNIHDGSNQWLKAESNTNSDVWLNRPIPGAPSYPLNLDTWYHLVVSADAGTVKTYLDGVLIDTETPSNDMTINEIGGGFSIHNDNYHSGSLDEIRFSNIGRSAEFIFTSYNNQNDTSSFFIIGNQEVEFPTTQGITSITGVTSITI